MLNAAFVSAVLVSEFGLLLFLRLSVLSVTVFTGSPRLLNGLLVSAPYATLSTEIFDTLLCSFDPHWFLDEREGERNSGLAIGKATTFPSFQITIRYPFSMDCLSLSFFFNAELQLPIELCNGNDEILTG